MLILNKFLIIFFFSGIFYFGKYLSKKYFFNLKENLIFFYSLVLFLIAAFINISFFFNINNINILNFLFYLFILISFLNLKNLLANIKFFFISIKEEKNSSYLVLIFLILIYLLISYLPTSDPDSLDYHLGAPDKWLKEGGFFKDYYWLNYRLIGFGEFLNYFGLVVNINNFASITQFVYLILFCHFLKVNNIFTESKLEINLIYLSFLSMPIVLSLIFSQKFFLMPSLIVVSSLIYFLKNIKTPDKINYFLLTSSIYFTFMVKINFIVYLVIINILFLRLFKTKIFLKVIFYNVILIIVVSPFYLRNLIFYGDPISPFLEFIKNNPDISYVNFANYLRLYETDMNSIVSTIKTILKNFVPLNFNHITTIFGIFIFYIFYQKKKKNFLSFLYLGVLILILHLCIGQFSSRYLLVGILLISIYLIINLKNSNLIRYLIFSQALMIIIFSLFPIYNYFSDTKKYLNNFAYEYNESQWLNKNLKQKIYISDIRSIYLLENNHISFLNYLEQSKESVAIKNNNLKDFIIKNDILFISLKSFSYDHFKSSYKYINDCFVEIKKKKFEIITRKPIFLRNLENKFLIRRIFKRNYETENC